MTGDFIRLAELLCSRLCHDLAGPAGAIANGAELIGEEDPETAAEAADLMAGAAGQLGNRLRFFRAAFGWEGGAARDLTEAGRIAADFLAPLPGQPPRFTLSGPEGANPGPDGLKLLHLFVLLGSEALPRGGSLRLETQSDGVSLLAEGAGVGLFQETEAHLLGRDDAPPPSPRTAPALLARSLAQDTGWRLSVETSPERLCLKANR
ncbi:MAG: hypothetical protein HQL45_09955 [Alphaproteobacteria bacterium]|nr:hypothetical protein [Alphaproteobacteria bacterium]